MLLRNATVFDIPALLQLEQICLGDDPWSEDSLRATIKDPMCLTKVVVNGGEILGYISGRMIPHEAEIYRVATLPNHRRLGVGSALLAAFLGSASSHGCDTFFLEVRASNMAAQGLYAAHGFEKIGTRRAYYRNPTEDAILFALHTKEVVSC